MLFKYYILVENEGRDNMKKTNKVLVVILLLLVVGVVGLTIAYFSNSTSVDNVFTTQPYGTTVNEDFVAPSNWLPGDVTDIMRNFA